MQLLKSGAISPKTNNLLPVSFFIDAKYLASSFSLIVEVKLIITSGEATAAWLKQQKADFGFFAIGSIYFPLTTVKDRFGEITLQVS